MLVRIQKIALRTNQLIKIGARRGRHKSRIGLFGHQNSHIHPRQRGIGQAASAPSVGTSTAWSKNALRAHCWAR